MKKGQGTRDEGQVGFEQGIWVWHLSQITLISQNSHTLPKTHARLSLVPSP
jgi:hypothetical protein